jgi:hypothetical protein
MAEILPRPGVEFNADYVRFRLDHDPDIWVYVRDVTGAKQVLNPPGATFRALLFTVTRTSIWQFCLRAYRKGGS